MRGAPLRLATLAAVLAALVGAAAPAAAAQRPALPEFRVIARPSPLPATDGRRHLAYEILVRNETRARVTLNRLEVRNGTGRRLLAAHFDGAIAERMVNTALRPTRTLPPGQTGMIVLDVTLAQGRAAPERLLHRIGLALRRPGIRTRRVTVDRARTRVTRQAPVRLAPPLRGVDLLAVGCCGRPFAHRLALLARAGEPVIAQRYAIDFLRVDTLDQTHAGDPAVNASYFVYGDEVLAAAAGRIAATRDGVPDNTPPGAPPGVEPDDLAGNYVNQDLGGGRFALYAHLQPGSLRVRPGDVVQPGQVLGLVGNSGNSTEPHLHFHVMDGQGGASNLEAEGVPYTFDRLSVLARYTGMDAAPPAPVRRDVTPPLELSGRYPLSWTLVAFP
jgi:hypothetical protein